MKKTIIVSGGLICLLALFAQDRIFIHKNDKSVSASVLLQTDSLAFGKSASEMNLYRKDNSIFNHLVTSVDSITFGAGSDTVVVDFSGSTATITNPFENKGITVTQSNGDVIVNSTLTDYDVKYLLKGTTTNGSVKIYSNYRFELDLKGVNITNNDGPAINIQSGKKITVRLMDGTTSSLTDASSYATSTEDQKGTFFSEGQLSFVGGGALTVKSNSKHGICSDDYVQITSGSITVSGASKDGIHSKDYFKMEGGTVNVTATGDGIECETGHVLISGGSITTTNTAASVKGITCDSTFTMTGGTVNITANGNQSKGLKSGQNMVLSGGTITINTAGAAVLSALGSGYDVSYCTGIKSDADISVSGVTITITGTGQAGKGISSDKNLIMTSGNVNVNMSGAGATYTNSFGVLDSYTSSCFEADGNITILGGQLTTITSGSGSKGISADGNLTIGNTSSVPVINVTNTGTKLLVSGTANYTTANYSEPKAIKSDGVLTINNGTFTLSASQQGANAIDCDSTAYFNGGTIGITIGGNQSKGIKVSRLLTLAGGTINITSTGGVTLENTAASYYDPSYCTAIKGDENISICGSQITIRATGVASRGVSADQNLTMTSGKVDVSCGGNGSTYVNSLGATDSYNGSCFTADGNVSVIGGTLISANSGNGGKTLSADGTITIGDTSNSPIVTLTTTGSRFVVSGTDYCHPKTMVADGAIIINNGTNTLVSTDDGIHSGTSITINGGTNSITASSSTSGVGEGIESPSITFNGGVTNVTASNDGINATYGTVSGGTESNDNSNLYIKGGILIVAGSDAIDSNGNITISGGTTIVCGPTSQPEEGIDFNGSFTVTGGALISSGSNASMTKAMTSASQTSMYIKSSASLAATSILHIENASGTEMVTFKPKNAVYYFHVSTPLMAKSTSYKIYFGGTYTGGSYVGNSSGWGLYTGGTYSSSSATLKTTSTTSSSTYINTISF